MSETPVREVKVKFKEIGLHAVMRTDVGRRRTENQDSYGYSVGSSAGLFVVADGMGGARGGGTASAMAVELILNRDQAKLTATALESLIAACNRVIFTRSQEDMHLNGMGTTVVALAVKGDTGFIAHVGDSRIYRHRRGELVQLTRDHTLVQELVDSGAIQPEDAATHPIAHMLTRSLGPMATIGVEVAELDSKIEPGDRFVLCSDGLYNHCSKETIESVLGSASSAEAANQLVDIALEHGGTDNITIQVIEILSLEDAALKMVSGDLQLSRGTDQDPERVVNSEIDGTKVNGLSLSEYAASIAPQGEKVATQPQGSTAPKQASGSASDKKDSAKGGDWEDGLQDIDDDEPGESNRQITNQQRTNQQKTKSSSHPSKHADDELHEVSGLLEDGGFEDDLDLYESGINYDQEVSSPRWWSTIIAGSLTLVFAGVFYSLLKRDLFPQSSTQSKSPKSILKSAGHSAGKLDLFASANNSAQGSDAELPSSESADPQLADVSETYDSGPVLESATVTELGLDLESPINAPEAQRPQPDPTLEAAPVKSPPEGLAPDTPVSKAVLAEQIALANSFQIPAAPRLRLGIARSVTPTVPIRWEEDAKVISKISNAPVAPGTLVNPNALMTSEERVEVAEKKRQLREKISDLDIKLEMLVIENAQDVKTRLVRTEMEVKRAGEASAGLQREIGVLEKSVTDWQTLEKTSAASGPLVLAEKLSALAPDIRTKYQELRELTEKFEAVSKLAPKQGVGAEEIATLGQEKRQKQSEVEALVIEELSRGPENLRARVARLKNDRRAIENRRTLLNKHIGLLNAFVPANLARRKALQDQYLKERESSVKTLSELQLKLSDTDEAKFRLANVELFVND